MIDCLTNADWSSRRRDILEMHRLRCRVFKGRLDWEVEDRSGLEWDRFDMLDPIYLLAYDEDDRIVGTWRMLPTSGPYMLRDVFPQLLEGQPAPCSPDIWEGSRFAVDCEFSGRSSLGAVSRATAEIFCAVVELSLVLGAKEVVTVYDSRIARLLPRIGVSAKWQSRAMQIGKTSTHAGRFDVSETVLDRIRDKTRIQGSVLRYAPVLDRAAQPLPARQPVPMRRPAPAVPERFAA